VSKQKVNGIAAVGIIYAASNPTKIFIEVKDDGHPIKLVRRQLCPIGGNWIGERAKPDANPLVTFRRELDEELSFDRPIRDAGELVLLGQADSEVFAPTPDPSICPDQDDINKLVHIKSVIESLAVPFGDFINTVPKAVLDEADPDNKRDGFASLVSYFAIGLGEQDWAMLVALQKKFGNLSNESITLITTLDEIIRTDTKTAFGHDRVMQRFFLGYGQELAKDLPMVLGLESEYVGVSMETYAEYLARYDVLKHP